MSTASIKWTPGGMPVERRSARKARRERALRRLAQAQRAAVGYAEFERIRERNREVTPRRTLSRVEQALFASILATVGCLWLAQAAGVL